MVCICSVCCSLQFEITNLPLTVVNVILLLIVACEYTFSAYIGTSFALSSRRRRLDECEPTMPECQQDKCCGSAPGITSTDSRFMRYQSCHLLSASSAQHATSVLSSTAGCCQWSTTWHQSVAQHTITCDRSDPHCGLYLLTCSIVVAFWCLCCVSLLCYENKTVCRLDCTALKMMVGCWCCCHSCWHSTKSGSTAKCGYLLSLVSLALSFSHFLELSSSLFNVFTDNISLSVVSLLGI